MINRLALFKVIIDFGTLLIGAEGAKTPAGVRGRGDPAGAKSAEEKEKRKRLVQPRQALEVLPLKSFFDFSGRTEATSRG